MTKMTPRQRVLKRINRDAVLLANVLYSYAKAWCRDDALKALAYLVRKAKEGR